MRPGPAYITRNRAPGGLVFHVYDLEGRLVTESRIRDLRDAARQAELDGRQAFGRVRGPIVLVVYDGDTGRRLRAGEIRP